jgi:hypothetical protein
VIKKDEPRTLEHVERIEDAPQTSSPEKKPFVEPNISAPINVFDATTFFLQGTEGGGDL